MTTELALIDEITEDKWPEIYGVNKINDYYDRVRAELLSEVPDLTTVKGREAIASNSRKVSTSKTFVEKPGRAYLKFIKETKCAAIEKELREFVEKMDALRDEVRKPLTDYETEQKAIEAKRIADEAAAEAARLAEIAARELQEQVDRDHELAVFMYAEFLRQKEEDAKQAIIFAAAVEKERVEREEQIARAAAQNARIEAERAAEAEKLRIKDEAERQVREQQLATERAQREKAEAEAEALRQKQAAEAAKAKALLDAENAAKAALAKAEADKQAAIEAERQRVERERLEAERAQQELEKNRAHVGQKRKEAKEALMLVCGLTEETAKAVVMAIAQSKIDNTEIKY